MQTFLPYPDFRASAASLDYRRLGKQRVEAFQILNTLSSGSRWENHPAVKMWRGSEHALAWYMDCMIDEWLKRGYNNTMVKNYPSEPLFTAFEGWGPSWLGREDFHRSHRANLVRKDPEFYIPKFGNLAWEPYIWPIS